MNSTQYPFKILCPHKADPSIPSDRTLPDYHPISREEIAKLLNFARDHKEDVVAISGALVRLGQGIPGVTCPRSLDDDVARKNVELDQIFWDRYELGGTSDLVEVLESLMRA